MDLLPFPDYEKLNGPPAFGDGVNAYVCDSCNQILITVDRTAGTTPFLMACENPKHREPPPEPPGPVFYGSGKPARPMADQIRRNGGQPLKPLPAGTVFMPDGSPVCSRSCMYRTPFKVSQATVEFYRPPYSVYVQMKPGPLRDHVTRGGLLFRHIGAGDDPNIKAIEIGYGDKTE
jgi:hypothetical protein